MIVAAVRCTRHGFVPLVLLALGFSALTGFGSTFVVTNTNDSGYGSLRQAIDLANVTPNDGGPDEIDFNVPGGGVQTIVLASALSTIIEPVIINGWSQPGGNGAPVIEVTAQASTTMDGLTVTGGSTTIPRLVLNNSAKATAVFSNDHNT